MYRLSWRTAKPLEPFSIPGYDNGPVEGLLPALPLWFKTVHERLHSYGSYRPVILFYQEKFIWLSECNHGSACVQNEFLLYFHYAHPLNYAIQLHHQEALINHIENTNNFAY